MNSVSAFRFLDARGLSPGTDVVNPSAASEPGTGRVEDPGRVGDPPPEVESGCRLPVRIYEGTEIPNLLSAKLPSETLMRGCPLSSL